MKQQEALRKLRDTIRLRHFAWSTEQVYCAWLQRFINYLADSHGLGVSSEKKVELFLTQLAYQDVAASTQNQAFNALVFFYKEVAQTPLGNINALRANRPEQIRRAPLPEEVRAMLSKVKDVHGYPTRLIVHLIYGCGLRVTEPCNVRIQDVELRGQQLMIKSAKRNKDRVVALPCSLYAGLRDQMERARILWKQDVENRVPVALPGLLAKKYPASQFAWEWAWLFPSKSTCRHPRTGVTVRYRVHESNVQKAVREACRAAGVDFKPHELRHAYATHCLNAGQNPRAIQKAMGHSQLETTMNYLHAEAMGVRSPLDGAAPAAVVAGSAWSGLTV